MHITRVPRVRSQRTLALLILISQGLTMGATRLNPSASVTARPTYHSLTGNVPEAGTQRVATVDGDVDVLPATFHNSLVANPTSVPTTNSTSPVPGCGGPTFNVNSGMSQSEIVSTISSAPPCATVLFAPGTYNITATINVPCGVSLAGPSVAGAIYATGDGYKHWGYTPTATINWTGSGGGGRATAFNFGSCSTTASVTYLEVNMGHPSPDGGQVARYNSVTSNVTIEYNYFHGNQSLSASSGSSGNDALIWFDGNSSNTPGNNITIAWNRLGASGDCSNIMKAFNKDSAGTYLNGFCVGIGFHTNETNLTIENNTTYYQEQGLKFAEGAPGSDGGMSTCLTCTVEYNDYSNIHRIDFEEQVNNGNAPTSASSPAVSLTARYNSIHDPYSPQESSYGLSIANGCTNHNPSLAGCVANTDYNVIIDNVATTGSFNGLGIEQWGSTGTTANYNLIQGEWSNSIDIAQDGAVIDSYNHIQSSYGAGGKNNPGNCYPGYVGAYGWWSMEDSPANKPSASGTGNVCDFFDGSGQTSASPTISPASGTYSTAQTVTLTNTGTNRDTNTTIWYTTDGTTPVPGSGTAMPLYNGGTFTTPPSGTVLVKAVGMWGSPNQPTAYASGYGYVPSAVISASYTIGTGTGPGKTVPTISWTTPAAIQYGTPLNSQLDAAANVPGTFTYTPAAGTKLTAGTQTLSTVFTPTDTQSYATATDQVQLTVTQATPAISWAAPAAIVQGTALGSAQLNASASVPGGFSYNPAAGNVPAAGTLQMTAAFTPADSTDYAPATASDTLVVNPTTACEGSTVNVNSSMSQSTLASAISSAPNCAVVLFAAGDYNIAATIDVPCGVSLAGPAVPGAMYTTGDGYLHWGYTPTATINWTGSGGSSAIVFNFGSCTAAHSIEYLEVNSNHPSPEGGTAIYHSTVSGNVTIKYNYFHGNQAGTPTNSYDSLIYFDGNSSASPDTNVDIEWNRLGAGGDCSNVMTKLSNEGGSCNGIGFHTSASDLTIKSNTVYFQEQGQKFYQGTAGGMYTCLNCAVEYNDWGSIHRIDFETQANGSSSPAVSMIVRYNSIHDPYTPDSSSFGLRVANGCSNHDPSSSGCVTNTDYNVVIDNVAVTSGAPFNGLGIEQWGSTGSTANYNLVQGEWSNSMMLSQDGAFSDSNNHIQSSYGAGGSNTPANCHPGYAGAYGWWGIEDNAANTASGSGNQCDFLDGSAQTSVAPTISPAGGNFTQSQTVTFTNPGQNRDANTGIWYTTDGSTPAPGAGTASYIASGGTITVTAATTVKAVGMWGSQNQPTSYPAGYGYIPSAVVSAVYTGGNTPPPPATLVGVALLPAYGGATMPVGGTMQMVAHATYSDGSSGTLPDQHGNAVTAWNTSDHKVAVVSTKGHATAVSAGSMNIEAMVGTLSATPLSVTVTAPSQAGATSDTSAVPEVKARETGAAGGELVSVAIDPAQAVVAIGATTQLKATATFKDGSSKDVTGEFAWTSSNPRTVGAAASGSLSGLATGQATITGSYQGVQASAAAASTAGEVEWSGPIVITKGGAYSGNWQSTDNKKPAVTVATTAPVVIENAHIRSVGGLIKTSVAGANLTVRNTAGVALNSGVKGQSNGIFLEVDSPVRLDVENNYMENASSGVLVHGYSGDRDGKQTIVIRANRARNLTGLLSDGKGGYSPGEGANHTVSRFIELDNVQAVPGIDVGWNEVINYSSQSLVSDDIDVNRSSGTTNQPLEIHDNYVQGAYPYNATQDAYTGGGIKTEGSPDDSPQDATAFSDIHDNQVVSTVGYGIEFTAGHDNIASNNRVISSGLLADGSRIAAQNVGMANGDVNGANGSMYNNTMRDNLIGWACWSSSCSQTGYRRDESFPASPGDYSTNSVLEDQPITLAVENNEYQLWLNKILSDGIAVGPSF